MNDAIKLSPETSSQAASLPQLSVVVPTFNERDNVTVLYRRLDAILKDVSWEVIFVDDNSPDGTWDVVRALARKDSRVRCIRRIGRRGLSGACIEGILASSAPYAAVMDADLQHDETQLPKMLGLLQSGEAELVVGSRYIEGYKADGFNKQRAGASAFATEIARRALKVEVADPMSGFFMIRADVLRDLAPSLSGVGFKILLDILTAARRPLRFVELPYRFRSREAGASKLDHAVALEYLIMLYDKAFGRLVPTRFALFSAIGGLGVAVHFAALSLFFQGLGQGFAVAQAIATIIAMTFNFFLNNSLTYRDRQLAGPRQLLLGWLSFCLVCGIGAAANVGVATWLFEAQHALWTLSALAGIAIGAVWNFALSSRFTWGRY